MYFIIIKNISGDNKYNNYLLFLFLYQYEKLESLKYRVIYHFKHYQKISSDCETK